MCLNHGSQSPFRNKRGWHLKRKGVRVGKRGDNKYLCGGKINPWGEAEGTRQCVKESYRNSQRGKRWAQLIQVLEAASRPVFLCVPGGGKTWFQIPVWPFPNCVVWVNFLIGRSSSMGIWTSLVVQ